MGAYIIKSFLTRLKSSEPSRHHINILAGGSELERTVDWPRILPTRVTFESLQRRRVEAYVKRIVTFTSRQKSAHKPHDYIKLSPAPTCV